MAAKTPSNNEGQRILLWISNHYIAEADKFRQRQGIVTRQEALRRLIARELDRGADAPFEGEIRIPGLTPDDVSRVRLYLIRALREAEEKCRAGVADVYTKMDARVLPSLIGKVVCAWITPKPGGVPIPVAEHGKDAGNDSGDDSGSVKENAK